RHADGRARRGVGLPRRDAGARLGLPRHTLSRGGVPRSLRDNKAIRARFRRAAPGRMQRAILMAGYELGGRLSPFQPVWNRERFRAVKARLSIPVFAVGGIRTADDVNQILDDGEADMV